MRIRILLTLLVLKNRLLLKWSQCKHSKKGTVRRDWNDVDNRKRERRARETPEERDRRRSLRNQRDRERRRARCAARCASALAQLERVCTCIIIRIRIYIRELAHARPPMSSISLVLCWVESISSSLEVKKSITTTIIDASKNGLVSLFGVSVPLHSHANSLYHPQNCSSLLTSSPLFGPALGLGDHHVNIRILIGKQVYG